MFLHWYRIRQKKSKTYVYLHNICICMLTYGGAQGAARKGSGKAQRLSSCGAEDLAARERVRRREGTQFSCFNGTKVQLRLTLVERAAAQAQGASRHCFSSNSAGLKAMPARGGAFTSLPEKQSLQGEALLRRRERQVLSLLALLVQKYQD